MPFWVLGWFYFLYYFPFFLINGAIKAYQDISRWRPLNSLNQFDQIKLLYFLAHLLYLLAQALS